MEDVTTTTKNPGFYATDAHGLTFGGAYPTVEGAEAFIRLLALDPDYADEVFSAREFEWCPACTVDTPDWVEVRCPFDPACAHGLVPV
jgi:hypothetical protein